MLVVADVVSSVQITSRLMLEGRSVFKLQVIEARTLPTPIRTSADLISSLCITTYTSSPNPVTYPDRVLT